MPDSPKSNTEQIGPPQDPAPIEIRDKRKQPQFGMLLMDEVDTDAYRSLSLGARSLHALLVVHANHTSRRAWPTQKTLARIAGCSIRGVRNWVRELADADFLTVKTRRKIGFRSYNIYTLKTPGETLDPDDADGE